MGTPLGSAPADQVRRQAALLLRDRIEELAEETMREIETRIPEYDRPAEEIYTRTVRAGVEQALRRFMDILERRDANAGNWRDVYRAIGAGEKREGRSLDALQAAIRIGARVGCRRLVQVAEEESLPVATISSLSDAIWAHVDNLAQAAAEGYAEAGVAEAGELDRRRRRLLTLLTGEPPAGRDAIVAAAAAASWSVPQRLAAVALEPRTARTVPPILPPEILVDLDPAASPQPGRPGSPARSPAPAGPALIVPDPESRAQVRVLVNALRGYRAAVGPAVPPEEAAGSLRWARRALALAGRGIIADDAPVWCADHLATLTIFQDEALLATIIRRRLAPLAKVRENQREPLAETLLAWLQHNMNANAVAAALHVHPQTVRRRLRQIDWLFGDQVCEPDVRFELEIALRAWRAQRASRTDRRRRGERPESIAVLRRDDRIGTVAPRAAG